MDMLIEKEIAKRLDKSLSDVSINVFGETDSTNLEAKRFAAEKSGERAVFLAESQTLGRGRFGRSFFSPEGCGIYMSILLPIATEKIADITLMTPAAAVAVCEAMEKVCGKDPLIKWVNDLYLDGKKVCGILAEAVSDPKRGVISHVVIGMGINFKDSGELPEELREIVGTLFGEENTQISRNELAAAVINELLLMLPSISDRRFLAGYRSRSMLTGQEVVFARGDKKYTAIAEDIDDNGALVVRFEDGRTESLSSGEVSVRTAASAASLPFPNGNR